MQLKYKVLEGDRVLAACLWLRLLSCRVRGWVALNELLSTFFKSGVLGPELGMDPLMFSTKKEQQQWLSCYSMGVPIVPGLSVVQLNPKMNTTSLSLLRAELAHFPPPCSLPTQLTHPGPFLNRGPLS